MDINKCFVNKMNYIIENYNNNKNDLLYHINNISKDINNSLEIKNTIISYISKFNLDKIEYIKYQNNYSKKIILIVQCYNTTDIQRQKENTICLINNILNPLIDNIILLNEEFYDLNSILKDLTPQIKTKIRQKIDMVDVFRAREFVLDITKQAIKVNADILWTQEGIIDEESALLANKAGLTVVMNKCPKKILED